MDHLIEAIEFITANGGLKPMDAEDYEIWAGVEGNAWVCYAEERAAVLDADTLGIYDADGVMVAVFEWAALEI